MLPVPDLLKHINTLLTEAYAGPPDPRATWFIDNEPDSGILGILKGVTAQEASLSVDGSGKPGTTIAANAEHLRWSLANTNAALRGEVFNSQWSESWLLQGADEAGWDRLRNSLRSEFETLLAALQGVRNFPEDNYLTGVLALLPHAAYHLGTLRQMIERVREKS